MSKSNTLNAMELLEKYSTTSQKKDKKAVNPFRVTVGNVFIQPTKADTASPNFKFCYYGCSDEEQEVEREGEMINVKPFIAGFTMSNRKMLEMVQAEMISPAFVDTFNAFATKYAGEHQVI